MILSRYISKTITSTIFIVALVLLGIEIFIEFTREFPSIGTGDYNFVQVLRYVPMMLPQDIYQLFPMAGLLGGLLGLGILTSNNELVVMRASGLSISEIMWIVFKTSLFLAVFMLLVGEVLAPIAQKNALAKKLEAMSSGQTLVTNKGVWMHNNNNFIHIDSITPEMHAKDILRYKFDNDSNLQLASFAKEGFYNDGVWTFKDISETKFLKNKTVSKTFTTQNWDIDINPRLSGLKNIDPEQKSLPELYKYTQYREKSGLNANRYKFVFWQRIFQPLSIIVMILLSVPVIFGFLRTKAMGFRMIIGASVGFSFHIINQFVCQLTIAYGLPSILTALLPIFAYAILMFALLFKK